MLLCGRVLQRSHTVALDLCQPLGQLHLLALVLDEVIGKAIICLRATAVVFNALCLRICCGLLLFNQLTLKTNPLA